MKVEVNGTTTILGSETTISDLLKKLNIQVENGVAVALNYGVVPKSNYSDTVIKEGDTLEVIHATAGG